MTVRADSRYRLDDTFVVETTDRGSLVVVLPQPPPSRGAFTVYMAREGDTMEILAFYKYGTPTLYWRIAQLNPTIGFADQLAAGTLIRIPV